MHVDILVDETVAPVCPTLDSLAAVGLDCTKAQKSYGFEAIQCNDDSDCKSNDLLLPPTTKRFVTDSQFRGIWGSDFRVLGLFYLGTKQK